MKILVLVAVVVIAVALTIAAVTYDSHEPVPVVTTMPAASLR